jgi:phage FluMu protein gp41
VLATEHEFTLPVGYDAGTGELHRTGTMRLATAADEILPLADPRVQRNEAYLAVILLSRVVTRLGPLAGDEITPRTIEALFAADLAHLQDLYNEVNRVEAGTVAVSCPSCSHDFELERERLGGS